MDLTARRRRRDAAYEAKCALDDQLDTPEWANLLELITHYEDLSGPFATQAQDPRTSLLADTLQISVPLLLMEVRHRPDRDAVLRDWATPSVDALIESSDTMLYGGRHAARTFAHLTRAIVALSFAPGGVCFAGLRFCAIHHPGGLPVTRPTACFRCARLARHARRAAS